jgi:hypothetical protein
MKLCGRCKISKPVEEFHRRAVNSDGLTSYCKECAKQYYKKWVNQTPERKNRHSVWRKERVAILRTNLVEYLKERSCVDCGISDIRILEFDHVRDTKILGVAEMINRGNTWEKVLTEIAKCEIRCCNCHRIKTSERGNWWFNGGVTG